MYCRYNFLAFCCLLGVSGGSNRTSQQAGKKKGGTLSFHAKTVLYFYLERETKLSRERRRHPVPRCARTTVTLPFTFELDVVLVGNLQQRCAKLGFYLGLRPVVLEEGHVHLLPSRR